MNILILYLFPLLLEICAYVLCIFFMFSWTEFFPVSALYHFISCVICTEILGVYSTVLIYFFAIKSVLIAERLQWEKRRQCEVKETK